MKEVKLLNSNFEFKSRFGPKWLKTMNWSHRYSQVRKVKAHDELKICLGEGVVLSPPLN